MPDESHAEESPSNDVRKDRPEVELYDPWTEHFVSQNNRNDFQKSLESSATTDL